MSTPDMFAPDRRVHFKWAPAKGDIIQVKTGADEIFGGCIMVVDEVAAWGVVAYVDVPGNGLIFWRCPWAKLDFTGGRALAGPDLARAPVRDLTAT